MSLHYITKCRYCKTVMGQCRCPSPDKTVKLDDCGCMDGKYIPNGGERDNGTDFAYEELAWDGCKTCGGFGEFHVPYEDYHTYIIHRCYCSFPANSQAVDPDPTDDAQQWRDFFRKGIETIAGQRHEIKRLKERIVALGEGECRFHCRMRKDMWKAGGKYVLENWEKRALPADCHYEQMYLEWRKHHDNKT